MTRHNRLVQLTESLTSPAPLKAIRDRLLRRAPEPAPSVHLAVLPSRAGDPAKREAGDLFLAAIHDGVGPLSLEIMSSGGHITFGLRCRSDARTYLEGQLAAQYPGVSFTDQTDALPGGQPSARATCTLALEPLLPDAIPFCHGDQADADPLSALLAALAGVSADDSVHISILAQSMPNNWQPGILAHAAAVRDGLTPRRGWTWLVQEPAREIAGLLTYAARAAVGSGATTARAMAEKPVQLSPLQQDVLAAIEEKARWPGFRTAVRLDVWADSREAAGERARSIVAAFHRTACPHLNSFVARRLNSEETLSDRRFLSKHGFTLSIPELSSLWRLPDRDCMVAGITWASVRRAEPPALLPTTGCTFLGRTAFRADERDFGLLENDRFRHLYLVGKAGAGKSTLLKNMIIQDMRQGRGLALLDPHGDLYDELLDYIPPDRVKDVVLLDPGDQEHPVSLNVLELPDPSQKAQVASALVDILKRSFEHSWGPRLEYILRNCILTLLEVPNSTIMGIPRLLSDDGYRSWAIAQINDPVMRFFWQKEFAGMLANPRLVTEAISPVQNKVGQFLAAPLLRHVLAQPQSTINMQDIMDTSKILLVNLSKGRIGEDSSSLLGAMIISSLHFAALRRVSQPEGQRRPFLLYADEFQSFATSTFASILSEARKYRLGLILAHQYISQLPEDVRAAIFGNVGTLVSFTVGPDDARFLERQYAPALSAEDLMNLDRYHMAVRLLVEGTVTPGFTAAGLPPLDGKTDQRDRTIAASRARYARDIAVVEKKIRTWTERVYHAPRSEGFATATSGRLREEYPRLALVAEDGDDIPATDQIGDKGE